MQERESSADVSKSRGVVVRDVDAFRRVLLAGRSPGSARPRAAEPRFAETARRAPAPCHRADGPPAADGVVDEREHEEWFQRMIPTERARIRAQWAFERAGAQRERAYGRARARRDMVDGAIVMAAYVLVTSFLRLDFILGPLVRTPVAALVGAAVGYALYLVHGGRFIASALGAIGYLLTHVIAGGLDVLVLFYGTFGALALWAAHGASRESNLLLEGRPMAPDDPRRSWLRTWNGPGGPGGGSDALPNVGRSDASIATTRQRSDRVSR
jgi:hypothetical protein